MPTKEDFELLVKKSGNKAKAQTEKLKQIASDAEKFNQNLDLTKLSKFDEPAPSNTEHKEIHNHYHYYYDNLGYIALGIATVGALAFGALYFGGFLTPTATLALNQVQGNALPELSPAQLKAMSATLIETSKEFGQTNTGRFVDTFYKGLMYRAKDTPISITTLQNYINKSLEEASTYIAENINNNIQNLDYIGSLNIDPAIAGYVCDPINNFGSPTRLKDFAPMLKATLAAGLTFTKIKAAYGYETPDMNLPSEEIILADDNFEIPEQCTFFDKPQESDSSMLLGSFNNSANIDIDYCFNN